MKDHDGVGTLFAVVYGRVQGVGFRYFVKTRAEAIGVHGKVRNLVDGAVEVKATGDREALEAFLIDLQTGPKMSKVEEVDFEWDLPLEPFDKFSVSF